MKPPEAQQKSAQEESGADLNKSRKSSTKETKEEHTLQDTQKSSLKSESTATSGSSFSSARNDTNHKYANVPPPQRGAMKKFFLRLTEKMGGIEKTEYTPEFNDSCHEIDNYKLSLEDMTTYLIGIAQRNPKNAPIPFVRMEFDYHVGQNPYELLIPAIQQYSGLLNDSNMISKQLQSSEKLGQLYRDFHRRARRSLKEIRYFLSVEYSEFCEARRVLNQRRQDMDYAKHELKNAKAPEVIDMKNRVFEHAKSLFDEELAKVLKIMGMYPRQKESHAKNVVTFFALYRLFHEQMALALKP
uniref:BAR domain-containing protein n=1 Tax=Panagrolaimus sp. JU765 TaxID=591449 RepID=A0AC34RAK2_9BILA